MSEPKSAFQVREEKGLEGHLSFSKRANFNSVTPENQIKLQLIFDDTRNVIRAYYSKDERQFNDKFKELLMIAKATFSDEGFRENEGSQSLQAYCDAILKQEVPIIKNRYLKGFLSTTIYYSVCILACAVILFYVTVGNSAVISSCAALSISTAWGVWVSASMRHVSPSFEQLRNIEDDFLKPWARILVICIMSFMFSLFSHYQFVIIEIGNFSSKNIFTSPLEALLLGFSLGLSDRALPSYINQHTSKLLSKPK